MILMLHPIHSFIYFNIHGADGSLDRLLVTFAVQNECAQIVCERKLMEQRGSTPVMQRSDIHTCCFSSDSRVSEASAGF